MRQDLHAFAARWFDEVWNKRLVASLEELMAPDCIGQIEGAEIRSRDEFKAQRDALLDTFPDFRIAVEETIVEDINVVTRWHVTGTHRGGSLGIAPTGAPVSISGMTWMKVEDGRIVRGWDSWNQGAVLEFLRGEAAKQGLPS